MNDIRNSSSFLLEDQDRLVTNPYTNNSMFANTSESIWQDKSLHNALYATHNKTVFFTSTCVEITTVFVLCVGVIGNILGAITFLCCPWGRKTLAVDKIIGLICLTGLVTTFVCAPVHLVIFYTQTFPMNSTACQLQGFLLNLLCLMSIWYSLVLSFERLLRIVSPHEHRLTFSSLNLNVILSGVFVLLVVEVSGPIYGWAEYGYVADSAICLLNPQAKHIFTYSVVHTSCYIVFPTLVTCLAIVYVVRESVKCNTKLNRGSQVLKDIRSVLPLCGAVILSIGLMAPYYTTLIRQACNYVVSSQEKALGYWMHILSVTCVYPCVLFGLSSKETWPALWYLLSHFPSREKGNDDYRGSLHISAISSKSPDSNSKILE